MKAVVLNKLGGVGNLQYKSVDIPTPKKDEVLVKVEYCGLNHLDLLIRQGKRPGSKIFPHILGSEIVGQVAKTGERVVVYPWLFCGECKLCKEGFENICDNGGTIGRNSWGGYAEYVVVPAKNIVNIPSTLDSKTVCSANLAGITAYHLTQRATITDGSSVLVTGATGGVGTLLIQILKSKKCQIICTTSHKDKIPALKNLGADWVVSTTDLIDEVQKIYPKGVDFIVDMMGGDVWSKAVKILAKNGSLVFCATTLDGQGMVDIGSAFFKQINIRGSYGGTINDLKAVLSLLDRGVIKPVIDSVYDLKDAKDAQEQLETQQVFGKILLKA